MAVVVSALLFSWGPDIPVLLRATGKLFGACTAASTSLCKLLDKGISAISMVVQMIRFRFQGADKDYGIGNLPNAECAECFHMCRRRSRGTMC